MGFTSHPLVLPLATGEATVDLVGGKGRALARLAAAGLPVPRGFDVTTAAYRQFVDANELQSAIGVALENAASTGPDALEPTSATIRGLIERGDMPEDIATAIRRAYADLGGGDKVAVAVRSSATTEDLANLSFAGQHETFLNVRGVEGVLDAVRRCWASLWTFGAMTYRARQGISADHAAMGVVVQELVPSEVSGVLFTANPVTGERGELVVNASFGLGEAIVSGQVTPDTYRVDRHTTMILEASLGDKQVQLAPAAGDGTLVRPTPEAQRTAPALPAPRLQELARLGLRIEAVFDGTPQDIEWALANDTLWVLQSRPITNLPPAPLHDVRWEPPTPGSAWIRRQVVENMPEPLSPLFAELYLRDGLDRSADAIYAVFDMPSPVTRLIDRPLFTTVNGYAYMRGSINFQWSVVPSLVHAYVQGLTALFKLGPEYWRDDALPRYLDLLEHWKSVDATSASDAELLSGIRELATADAIHWFAATLAIGVAKVTDGLLSWFLTTAAPERGVTSSALLRGVRSKAIEAETVLENIAEQIRHSERLTRIVVTTPARQLPQALRAVPEGQSVADALNAYLETYGHQIYNLDFVEPTQSEEPVPVLLSLGALVRAPARDITSRRQALTRERDDATESMARALDPLRRRLFLKLVGWARGFSPYREEALFYVGIGWPTLRRLALELGRRLEQAGAVDQASDVFFLESTEIQAASEARAAGRTRHDLALEARYRRELREAQKRLHPPAAVPPDYRLKLGPIDFSVFETQLRNLDQGNQLHGFGVSPGVATGPASLIRSPAEFDRMQPDSVLVCPTTTPAWTPLFAQARGLVTDVGGILAHGSIVAREYGIPAVMGTGTATQRISHGELVSVDGDTSTVTLLERDDQRAVSEAHGASRRGWPQKRTFGAAALVGVAAIGALSLVRRLRARNRPSVADQP